MGNYNISRLIIWALMPIIVWACAVKDRTQEEKVKDFLKYPAELEAVHGLVVKKKTVDAREKVDDYLNRSENIHWFGHAYYLKAFIYEIEEDFTNAEKYYRTAIDHGSQYESKVEAKALYNLSFVYERIDNRKDLLVSLLDLMKRRKFFDKLVREVEIPARLAAAYASQGKMKEALIFHREASTNFNKMVRVANFKAEKSEISKSLYYLGFATFDENNEPYANLVRKLSVGQKYFLAGAEASKSKWSTKSKDRLINRYQMAWGQVLEYKPEGFEGDPLGFKKNKQRKQLEMAADFYDLLHRLRAEEFPLANVNPRSKELMDYTSQWLDKVENYALRLNVGPETVRNKKVKNKALARYLEEAYEKPVANKEQVQKESAKKKKTITPVKKTLPEKQDIGKDPNL